MASVDDVKKLASLARLTVADEDLPRFVKDFEAILAYVSQLDELVLPEHLKDEKPALRNVMREDGEPHEPGLYTKKLTEQFPERQGDYLKVKQIISHD